MACSKRAQRARWGTATRTYSDISRFPFPASRFPFPFPLSRFVSRNKPTPQRIDRYTFSLPNPYRVLKKLKDDFAKVKHGEPGKRFIDHYRRHRETESKREAGWKTAAYIAAAIVLLIIGALLSLVPGVPGIVFGIPALGLLVARLKFFAVFMDRAELFLRRLIGKRSAQSE